MNHNYEEKIKTGFDKNVAYEDIRDRLISRYNKLVEKLSNTDKETTKILTLRKIIYTIISLTQLFCGSRIIEACVFFDKIVNSNDLKNPQVVKIAKSEATKIKYDKITGGVTKYQTKARFRTMKHIPCEWIDYSKIWPQIREVYLDMPKHKMRKRVLDYLRIYEKINTHTLRYSKINYLLNEKKQNIATVAKFVGHSSVGQLVTYTSQRQVENMYNL
jgi:integrase